METTDLIRNRLILSYQVRQNLLNGCLAIIRTKISIPLGMQPIQRSGVAFLWNAYNVWERFSTERYSLTGIVPVC